MQRANITETYLHFSALTDRFDTDKIIIHHTGSVIDDDLSAAQIHQMHLRQGWAGIGYHFVIRKNGKIERGRDIDAVGAHCYGQNSRSIGIHVCGNFDLASPTTAQIEMTAMLIANLCKDYGIPINDKHIFGHCDFDSTDCPGVNLYNKIPTIIGKANFYANIITVTVSSDKFIRDDTVRKIRDIFAESLNPYESLANTFDDFTSFTDNRIVFGNGNLFEKIIEIEPRV